MRYDVCACGNTKRGSSARCRNCGHGGWIKGRPNLKRRQTPETFWAKVQKGEGCWEYQGFRNPLGYGRTTQPGGIPGRLVMAHRIAWELTVGPVPEGRIVCHHCDNPPCVRPDHLYIGTLKDNAQDAVRAGQMGKGNRNRTRCKLGHPFDYVSPDGRRGCLTCRRRQAREAHDRARQRRAA